MTFGAGGKHDLHVRGVAAAGEPAERGQRGGGGAPLAAAALPALGRLTGRGNTANVEVVLAARPDVIVDYGSLGATYVSLADQVQKQTGVPYLLYRWQPRRDPRGVGGAGRSLGVPARGARSRALRRADAQRKSIGGWRGCRRSGGPASTTRAGPGGSRRRRRAPSMSRASTAWARGTWRARSRGGARLGAVSVEQVIAWDPEVIVTIDPAFARSLPGDPLWRDVGRCGTAASTWRRCCRFRG